MKKTLLYSVSIILCTLVFVIMPYLLLKSSFHNHCEMNTMRCEKFSDEHSSTLLTMLKPTR